MKQFKYISLFLAIALFYAACYFEHLESKKQVQYDKIANAASLELHKLEKEAQIFLENFAEKSIDGKIPESSILYRSLSQPPVEWLSVFIFQGDSLHWWSDNTVLPNYKNIEPGFKFYQNGWYKFIVIPSGNITVLGLLKIKNQFAFQNKFLDNSFHPCLKLNNNTTISSNKEAGAYTITGQQNKPVFYIQFHQASTTIPCSNVVALIYILSYLLFLFAVYYIILSLGRNEVKAGLFTLGTIIITRFFSVYYNFPESLYAFPLFSPSYYASSFLLNSLGDLLITSILLTYLVSVIYRMIGLRMRNYAGFVSRNSEKIIIGVALLITFCYSVFVNYLLSGLIINSRISFNINNVFELSVYSLIGVIIIGILLFSFFLVCDGVVRFIQQTKTNIQTITLIFGATLLFFIAHWIIFRDFFLISGYGVSGFVLTFFLIVYSGYVRKSMRHLNVYTRYLLIIFGFSIYAAQTVSEFNKIREKENRKLLAAKLENEQDQIAEYLFDDVAANVAGDPIINNYFAKSYEQLLHSVASTDIIEKRLTQLYFTGYWGKYDIEIKCFNNEGLPVNTGGDPTWNLDYFNIIIREDGRSTYSPYLFFSGNSAGRISYIGKIPVFDPENSDVQTGTIIINMESKILQDQAGFPELLLSDKIPQRKDISSYSYAHYRNGMLVNQFGNFNYLVSSQSYDNLYNRKLNEQFVNFDSYSHLFYRTSDDDLLIVSTRNPGILEFITLFSYLFTFFGICFLLIYTSASFIKNNGRISINFKNRIQVTVIAIVVTTMLLIGGASVYYIFKNYVTNVGLNINDRLKSMLLAIQDELSNRSLDHTKVSDEMNYTFSKLANTLAIDFNIYTAQGMLVYSTQPKIYDQSLVARTMNRDAIYNMVNKNKSLYIQYEEIGALEFLSAYEPVRNNNYKTIGFINLPYFAKQDALKKDISSFLVALINIYVLLFAFSIFITFIISNRITKPLQLIQQRLGKIKLGKTNELIEWDHDDEIGSLVKEYNRMVEELTESAELLARSERESAWREMAKQVAHEIKNPLTPMKLSVQHLQKAWQNQSPNIDQIMQRFSQTLIDQIETLSNIATEFSNFAKMPKANREVVNVAQILKSTVGLYSENESATISYYEHTNGDLFAFADKEQLIRVFSNLLKNAVQAIKEGEDGHIHVEIKKSDKNVIVSVKDNGVGISDEEKPRIFTPNFTTKTGGTGLGLAMVKNIIEQAGGQVWFTSIFNEGTVFYVALPLFIDANNKDAS